MTTVFDAALQALRLELGPGADARVRRTEARDDDSLVFTIESIDEPVCLRWKEARLDRLAIDGETALKFAPAIVAQRRAGTARILAWRPGRRLVARVHDARGHAVVKAWRRGRSIGALRVHEQARAALDGVLVVPRVEGADSNADAARYALFAGEELALDDIRSCARIGRGIATLQDRMDATDLPCHGRLEELATLRSLAARYERACGTTPHDLRRLVAELDALAADGPEPSVVAHRDLHDGQFAVAGEAVALFDFDLAARAEPELDVANLCAHVAWCGMQRARAVDERSSPRAERAVLDGYGRDLDERAFGFYRATTALRLALVWGLRPRWMSRVDGLVEMARRSLAEVTRA